MVPPKTSDGGSEAPRGARPGMLGRVLSERYRIDELVAGGAFGSVYRGLHLVMRKQVAIKILHPEIENFPELVERFEREAIAGAHVSHANVAAATDIGKFDAGSYFLVQEYVHGETLREVMNRGPLSPGRAGRIARQIAAALGAAHRHRIVHRDLKPTNVMLVQDTDDFVKLIDFGFARVPAGSLPQAPEDVHAPDWEDSQPGVVFGSVSYLAPEAALGMDNVTEQSDLYALGVMLYEMLAGRHPFDVTLPPNELFSQHRHGEVPPLSDRNPDVKVPEGLEKVVRRLLEKDPGQRFVDASATVVALDDALAGDADYALRTNPDSIRPSRYEAEAAQGAVVEPVIRRAFHGLAQRPQLVISMLLAAGVLTLIIAQIRADARTALPAPKASVAAPKPPPEKPKEPFEKRYRRETIAELVALAPKGDPTLAANALLALVDLDPAALSEKRVSAAAATVVERLQPNRGKTDAVFFALGHKAGTQGLDLLYQVVEQDPTSNSGRRANSILALAGVRNRASPALQVTWELHHAPCRNKPRLFERAGRFGDERTLRLLVPLQARKCKPREGECCFGRNLALDRAVAQIHERLKK